MGKTILICAVVIASACFVWSSGKHQENYVNFFAGVAMLKSDNSLTADSAAVLYRELLTLCGVTTEGAVEFLEKSKSDPIKWKEFYELVITAVAEQFNTK